MLLEFGMYGEMPSDVESGNIVCKYTVYDYVSYNLTQMFGKGNEPTQEWCDKNLPYIEGMKSVGQDDESGHKIEILSNNLNLIGNDIKMFAGYGVNKETGELNESILLEKDEDGYYIGVRTGWIETLYTDYIPVIPNQRYSIYAISKQRNRCYVRAIFLYDDENNLIKKYWDEASIQARYIDIPDNATKLRFQVVCENDKSDNHAIKVFLKHGELPNGFDQNFLGTEQDWLVDNGYCVEHKSHKKEISLNEPLRGVNNVKDKFVKIGGKWFIERNCIGVQFKDLKYTAVNIYLKDEFPDVIGFRLMGTGVNSPIMCDKYAYTNDRIINFGQLLTNEERINVYNSAKEFFITIKKAKLETLDIEGLMNYFSNNSLEIVGKADSTTYEPITDATLTTYLDTTHISNNSIIPCNMKIKNSGYNAIIKPSTLYTVALDTNRSGTIGINLGGAKVTTTNNVATVTTPATLTDDSLRLYGKDIKGSKVRLLEGDKTNWIPSFFEGMKSSFEDKLQDDGSYGIEVVSNNKNLFNGTWIRESSTSKRHISSYIKVSPNTKYIFSVSDNYNTNEAERRFTVTFYDKDKRFIGQNVTGYLPNNAIINTPYYCKYIKIMTRTNDSFTGEYTNIEECNVQLERGSTITPYTTSKSNKIQFSSIEPLRKWDRFVFKDGKLMIERYSKKVDLGVEWSSKQQLNTGIYRYTLNNVEGIYSMAETICNTITTVTLDDISDKCLKYFNNCIWYQTYNDFTLEELREYFTNSNTSLIFKLKEPTYEEIPHELQKIILEGYENGTLFFDTNIPPTSTVTYAGETPIVKSVKLNKTEVLNNTEDINDNIIPYLMDMDYRVVMLQLATEELEGGVSMARLFGGTYEMIKRDILSKRLTREEYGYRLADYFNAGKLTEEQVRELEELR